MTIKEMEDKKESVIGTPCEVYSRIVGYYRAVKNWNVGKAAEYKKRVPFTLDNQRKM